MYMNDLFATQYQKRIVISIGLLQKNKHFQNFTAKAKDIPVLT
jgi:hypothetical protein